MAGSKFPPRSLAIIDLSVKGMQPRDIAKKLGERPAIVHRVRNSARRAGLLAPVQRTEITSARDLTQAMRIWGVAGIGRYGAAIVALPPDARDWVIGKCTPDKTLSDVACELIIAAHAAEKR